MFSMPAGTPPDKVLAAVKNFAREEFGLKHRYAMVLHTDEPHPHVHMVVKAMSEQGVRLNIRKSTLREWRREFARHLRAQGVAANATDRGVRGESRSPKLDGIYRAEQRGESRDTRARAEAVAAELSKGNLRVEAGKAKLLETRKEVERGWWAVSDILVAEGRPEVAAQVRRFLAQMPPPRTDRESIAEALRGCTRKARTRDDLAAR
jgi:transposase-like protein